VPPPGVRQGRNHRVLFGRTVAPDDGTRPAQHRALPLRHLGLPSRRNADDLGGLHRQRGAAARLVQPLLQAITDEAGQ
jgi:hypothetical protein